MAIFFWMGTITYTIRETNGYRPTLVLMGNVKCFWEHKSITKRHFLSFFLFFKILFIYLIEITSRRRGRQRERKGSRLPAEQRARCGAQSQNLGIMTQAEGRGFNPLSHPGAPILFWKDFIYLTQREKAQARGCGRGSRHPTEQGAQCGA